MIRVEAGGLAVERGIVFILGRLANIHDGAVAYWQ
jgi:hypothetical protein